MRHRRGAAVIYPRYARECLYLSAGARNVATKCVGEGQRCWVWFRVGCRGELQAGKSLGRGDFIVPAACYKGIKPRFPILCGGV